jgi:hypothetical protein
VHGPWVTSGAEEAGPPAPPGGSFAPKGASSSAPQGRKKRPGSPATAQPLRQGCHGRPLPPRLFAAPLIPKGTRLDLIPLAFSSRSPTVARMKYQSQVYSQASGSIGGVTYSHNRYGLYTRARKTPTNPNSTAQIEARNRLAYFSTKWTLLSGVNRLLWAQWAAAVAKIDKMGQSIFITGKDWYVGLNSQRMLAGVAELSVPSSIYEYSQMTLPGATVSASTDEVSVTFTNTNPWAGAVGGFLNVFRGRIVAPGINFYRGPWRYIGSVFGDSSPPTVPAEFELGLNIVANQAMFFRFVAQTADGRPTPEGFVRTTASLIT